MRKKHVPMRTCVGCRTSAPKRDLIRIVRSPEGEVTLDLKGKSPGRGVYIHPQDSCLEKALKGRQIQRALEVTIPEEILADLKRVLHEQENE
ncbi:MAG TPA: YlxR family protein [Limnochordia bacterium]|nr:YlxR family protein [Limnochordia bacterium]